ncbi:type II toxin-antitoxin system RelE/ParE family toxin [Flavobacterium akiainvivens]|uniref:type II toxin-antitoxin system RelE/ParE family toxin n=1 Tax=Flavobacterium akiainvivens TaxID=1202724 RepID=UPI0008EEBCA4|nr:type II toxin-antitoxin system RelE/ParE family toxin [Flavobacterium akiainvivens]SFQ50070.1 toxin ParE1/3/4 [Flavobacterium akiainvivens]
MNQYRISAKAFKDLEDIYEYTFLNWSEEQANRYYLLLIQEIQYISEHFNEGKDMGHIRPGYKCSKVKSHLILDKKD